MQAQHNPATLFPGCAKACTLAENFAAPNQEVTCLYIEVKKS